MAGALLVEAVGPGATVQDRGRPGRMHEGIPPGGPWDPELFELAARALGNPPEAAALELPLAPARFRAAGELVVSLDGEVLSLRDGDPLPVPRCARAVRYLALPGGVDVPEVLGSRGTLLVAGLGGWEGRPLRPGDLLSAAADGPARREPLAAPERDDAPIRVVPGPDPFPAGELERLYSTAWEVSPALDRVGTRLAGAKLSARPANRPVSAPMVRGAIQVTADGTPIVLGPDHPTTGGYPVVAVVLSADFGRLARRPPGTALRFSPFASEAG